MEIQNKRLEQEDLLDPQKYKHDLKEAINKDYHRINVDSAKKKAVVQHMDYEGFHQMVLGADLKGLRPEEIVNVNVSRSDKILNGTKLREKLLVEKDVLDNHFTKQGSKANPPMSLLNQSGSRYDFYKNSTNKAAAMVQIDKEIGFSNFLEKELKSLEPNLFIEMLKSLVVYLQNESIDAVTRDSAQIKGIANGLLGYKGLDKLRMFCSKALKKQYEDQWEKYSSLDSFDGELLDSLKRISLL